MIWRVVSQKRVTTQIPKIELRGGIECLKKGSGCSLKKKKNIIEESDFDCESDFAEELVRDHHKKRSGGKRNGFKGYQDVMASSPSDNEPLAH